MRFELVNRITPLKFVGVGMATPTVPDVVLDAFEIVEGDTLPVLSGALQNSDGSAIDLTGSTVTFTMVDDAGKDRIKDASVTLVNDPDSGTPTTGLVTFAFTTQNTSIPGTYYGRFRINVGNSGSYMSVPTDEPIKIVVNKK